MKPLLSLAAVPLLLCGAPPASAASSYDSCTGVIAALPVVISTPGTWCLKKDLATSMASGAAITVQTNNVTIDCNGFRVGGLAAGMGTQTIGVLSDARLNTAVRGCRIRGFHDGIALVGDGGGHLVEDNVVEASTYIGMRVFGDGSVVRRNRILDTGGTTVQVGSAYGMEAGGAIEIVDNEIRGIVPSTDVEGGSNNTFGLWITSGVGLRIADNRFRDIQAFGWSLGHAIVMNGTMHAEIVDNSIVGTYAGVFCGSQTDVAWRNYFSYVGVPVHVCASAQNTVF
jgi:hypothetical protein